VIFDQRVDLMKDDSVAETVTDMRHAYVDDVVAKHVPEHAYAEQWDVAGLKDELNRVLGIELPVDEWAKEEGIADEEMLTRIEKRVDEHMAAKVAQWGPDVMRYVEKTILLQTLDHLWREHLIMLDHLRQVIGLRGYGQRDPLQEYKSEAFSLFETMTAHLREAVTAQLMRVEIVPPEQPPEPLPRWKRTRSIPNTGEDEMAFAKASLVPPTAAPPRDPKIPRPGARSAATRIAPAAAASATSTATANTGRAPKPHSPVSSRPSAQLRTGAGTHNHECWLWTTLWLQPHVTISIGGYGPRPSRGDSIACALAHPAISVSRKAPR
jgi:hypothetical protein